MYLTLTYKHTLSAALVETAGRALLPLWPCVFSYIRLKIYLYTLLHYSEITL